MKRIKPIKVITLDVDVIQDIDNKKKAYNFNFSEWVNETYKKEFMDIGRKQKEIDEHKYFVKKLQQEIREINKRNLSLVKKLTTEELKLVKQIPKLLEQGKEWSAITNRFNNTFKRSFTIDEFENIVKVVNDDNN